MLTLIALISTLSTAALASIIWFLVRLRWA